MEESEHQLCFIEFGVESPSEVAEQFKCVKAAYNVMTKAFENPACQKELDTQNVITSAQPTFRVSTFLYYYYRQ